MSHIQVRKPIEGTYAFAGRKWWYEFKALPNFFEDAAIKKFYGSLGSQYAKLTKYWNDDKHSEWITRLFMSLKMVLSASVMLESYLYAKEKNLRVVNTYLEYYSILTSLRALIFVSPNYSWDNGELIKMNHRKMINIASDILSKLDSTFAEKLEKDLLRLKAYREFISYRAPSSGEKALSKKNVFDIVDLCRMFVELAQLHSEIIESSFLKNAKGEFDFVEELMRHAFEAKIDGNHFFDEEDWYRLGYIIRKHPMPVNILQMMSEGHVEDFFGSWCADTEGNEDVFNPDENCGIIFDVP
jgi:hypothetical protein